MPCYFKNPKLIHHQHFPENLSSDDLPDAINYAALYGNCVDIWHRSCLFVHFRLT